MLEVFWGLVGGENDIGQLCSLIAPIINLLSIFVNKIQGVNKKWFCSAI